MAERKVAARCGVTPAYLSRVERGEVAPPGEETLINIARELGEDPDVMLAMAGSPTGPGAPSRAAPARPRSHAYRSERGGRDARRTARSDPHSSRLAAVDRTKELIDALVELDPEWGEFGRAGKPITQKALARLLKPLRREWDGVPSWSVRAYIATDLRDAFN